MDMMKKLTLGGVAVCGGLFGINLILHATHEHGHEQPAYPYMKIRGKAFPWDAEDCDLFDMECKRKWKASH